MRKRAKQFLLVHTLPPLVYVFLLLLRATLSITHVNRERMERAREDAGSMIACFWHGRLLLMPFAVKGVKAKVLISRHRDGEFIARVIRFFGLDTVRGSHRKGGVTSIREMITAMREGWNIAITPDGPKGPKEKIKEGLLELAKISQKPIIPVSYGARKKKPSTPGTASFCLILFRRLYSCGESLFTLTGMHPGLTWKVNG
ncbi:MAG TPA: lysophospholipid acyltransferase family protein [Syntrophorhabdales bacterium]|nr:lysophospholipid acyltransferase family protein [Syntrophorhabdales bacterium]